MNDTEMREKILYLINKQKGTSFVELMNHIGEESKGDQELSIKGNIILWSGVSDTFGTIMSELIQNDDIEMQAVSVLIYHADGGILNFPIPKRKPSKNGYKTPKWLPVVFNIPEGVNHE